MSRNAMAQTTYREALRSAHREALERDGRVFIMGEDVGRYGGSYAVTKGFLDEFGEARIRDTPLSELGFVGAGIGAALGGMRPTEALPVSPAAARNSSTKASTSFQSVYSKSFEVSVLCPRWCAIMRIINRLK